MRKFRIVHDYNIDLDTWFFVLNNPIPEQDEILHKLENVKDREEISRQETETHIHIKTRCTAIGMIPPAVRHILKPHMLSWIEESTQDIHGNFWTWNIVPYYFKERITCRGKMSMLPLDGTRCRRLTEGFLDIRMSVLQDFAERIIIEHLHKNFDQEYRLFNEVLKKRLLEIRKESSE